MAAWYSILRALRPLTNNQMTVIPPPARRRGLFFCAVSGYNAFMLTQTNPLIFRIILAFLVLNLLLPGESHNLSLVITQVIIYGLAAIHLLFLRPRYPLSPSWTVPAVLFGLALLVSLTASIHHFGSLQVSLQIMSMVLTAWLVADIGPGEREMRLSIAVVFGTAVILAVIGLLQLFTYFSQMPDAELIRRVMPVSDSYIQQIFSQKRIFATFALPTTFSAFLAMALPLGVALAIEYRKKLVLFAPIAGGLFLVALAMLQAKSHGGPVSLLAAAAVSALLIIRKRRILLLWSVAGVVLAGVVVLLAVGALRGNFLWDLAAPDSPIRLRWNLWMAGLGMWTQNWLPGIGLGNFHIGFLSHLGPGVRPTKYLHNTYLQVPIELGLLGIVLVVAILGIVLHRLMRETAEVERSGGVRKNALRLGLVVAVFVFLFANGIEIILYFHSVGMLGAFLVGMLIRREESPAEAQEVAGRGRISWLRIALACVFILAMAIVGRWFVADYFYNRSIDRVTQAALQPEFGPISGKTTPEGEELDPLSRAQRADLWRSVIEQASVAVAVEGGNFDYHYLLGRAYQNLSELEDDRELLLKAEEHFRCAVELCPDLPYLRYSHALTQLRLGRLLAATEEVAEAARLHPTSEDYRAALDALQRRIALMGMAGGARNEERTE